MATTPDFTGFAPQTVTWLKALKQHNNKEWFAAHRADYDAYVLNPARAFVTAMGRSLQELSPNIIAVPKIDRSIFRINRDTRFSADKSPYKTHIGIYFWEGIRPKMECPGYYFHLEPPNLMLGVGLYRLPQNLLTAYRKAVVHPELGAELTDIIQELSRHPDITLGGQHYKRIPAGYDDSHPNADLLKHNGLFAGRDMTIPSELYSAELVELCRSQFQRMQKLHQWLVKL